MGGRAGEPVGAALFFRRAGAGKKARLRLLKNTNFLSKRFSNTESNDDIFTLNYQNFIVLTKFTDSMASLDCAKIAGADLRGEGGKGFFLKPGGEFHPPPP